jgi:hypothetical protein
VTVSFAIPTAGFSANFAVFLAISTVKSFTAKGTKVLQSFAKQGIATAMAPGSVPLKKQSSNWLELAALIFP